MAKQVLDIRAGKGMTTSQSNEFLRNANGGERLKRWSGNYDSTREHLNFEIKKGGVVCEVDKKTSVPKRIKILERGDRISETGARHCSTEEYHAELREKLMSENEQLSQTIEGAADCYQGAARYFEWLGERHQTCHCQVQGPSDHDCQFGV